MVVLLWQRAVGSRHYHLADQQHRDNLGAAGQEGQGLGCPSMHGPNSWAAVVGPSQQQGAHAKQQPAHWALLL